jgi:hypothetical protein
MSAVTRGMGMCAGWLSPIVLTPLLFVDRDIPLAKMSSKTAGLVACATTSPVMYDDSAITEHLLQDDE